MTRRNELLCAWTGPLFAILFGVGFVLLAGYVPPHAPTDSAEAIAAIYREDTDRIRLGLMLGMFAFAFLAPWAAVIAAQTRRIEGHFAPLAYTQLISAAIGIVVVILPLLFWTAAAFRPADRAPELIRLLNDLGWIPFVMGIPPFIVWCLAIGFAILGDENPVPVFPRWAGYLNLWAAFLFVPGVLITFFKTGPFAWNGALAFYLILVVFFVWLTTMTMLVIKAAGSSSDRSAVAQAG